MIDDRSSSDRKHTHTHTHTHEKCIAEQAVSTSRRATMCSQAGSSLPKSEGLKSGLSDFCCCCFCFCFLRMLFRHATTTSERQRRHEREREKRKGKRRSSAARRSSYMQTGYSYLLLQCRLSLTQRFRKKKQETDKYTHGEAARYPGAHLSIITMTHMAHASDTDHRHTCST